MGEDALRRGFAILLMLFGVSFLIGWTTAFRNRLYLACVGVAFVALGGGMAIGSESLGALRLLLWVVAALAFLVGVWLAVVEVKRQMEAIEEQRRGLEREMHEYLTRLQAEHGRKGQEQPQGPDEAGPENEPDRSKTS